MNNYDNLLREKEDDDQFNDSSIEKHWAAMEKKMDTHTQQPQTKYRKLFRNAISIAAVLFLAFFGYTFFKEKTLQPNKIITATIIKSAITPPMAGTNVPYETFSFNATTGDTLFTLNGSIIIFPKNAVLTGKGEIVTGDIEVRSREFNDAFDYSIAGIPMDYDSAGTQYKFISSGMIDISAYQNGEPLQVNPNAKPQLNLVSTNKERKTNLYKLDTASGKWLNKGVDEVNLVEAKATNAASGKSIPLIETQILDNEFAKPLAPQKASNINPVINVVIDPASFKELLVYDGLKFEVLDAAAGKVEQDSKTEWDNIELKRGEKVGAYKVFFSAKSRVAIYNVKPVLEGKDFEAAEKLYQEKLKEYTKIKTGRKKSEQVLKEDNKRTEELNKLIAIRNRFIDAENVRIDAINEIQMRRDSSIKAKKEFAENRRKDFEKQQALWAQNNKTAALEQNLIRSFNIDGFGYWNCDQPSLPQAQQYVSSFKTIRNEVVTYNTLCIAEAGINRIRNYYNTNRIGLTPNSNCFGWAYNANRFYYFTRKDFKNALITNNPNTISIAMTLYEGDVKNYKELKGYIFNVNNSDDISKN